MPQAVRSEVRLASNFQTGRTTAREHCSGGLLCFHIA